MLLSFDMDRPLHRGVFVTGTDTGVGKTLVSSALMRAAKRLGLQVAGMKPVASGSEMTSAGLRNDDAVSLINEQSVSFAYDLVNPYAFVPAIAPHLAAAQAGITINFPKIAAAAKKLRDQSDIVIAEGAGGWYAPLSDDLTMADLAVTLSFPVLLVVALRLGCLSHALLTADAIAQTSLPLCGWVANRLDPQFPQWQKNIETLTKRLPAPLVGIIEYQPTPDIERAACNLDVTSLLARLPAPAARTRPK